MKTILLLICLLLAGVFFSDSAHSADVTITWTDNSTDEDGFRVERRLKQGPVSAYSQVGQVVNDVTSFTDTTIATSTQYCYRVFGFNATATSDFSNEACMLVTPSGLVIPKKP